MTTTRVAFHRMPFRGNHKLDGVNRFVRKTLC